MKWQCPLSKLKHINSQLHYCACNSIFCSFHEILSTEVEHFSAWIQISEGRETVSVLFKTTDELVRGGKVIAEHGCWSLLKGGIIANFSTHVEILFEVKYFSCLVFPIIFFLLNFILLI